MKDKILQNIPAALITLFIASRLISISILYWMTGGQEVASDVGYLKMMVDNPLGSFLGTARLEIASYPPLQPLLLAALYWPFSLFTSEFVAIRLTTTTIELFAFICALRISALNLVPKNLMNGALALLIIAPYTLLTSTFFVQDEVVCQLFVALAIYNILSKRIGWAQLFLVLGILTGKVFLIIPLFYIVIFNRIKIKYLPNLLLLVGVYAMVFYGAVIYGGNIPFVGFSPSADYASHFVVLLVQLEIISPSTLKLISLAISAIFQLLLTVFFVMNRKKLPLTEANLYYLCLPLVMFFFTFYQHNPEYVSIFALAALLLNHSTLAQFYTAATLTLAWIPNILNGVLNAINGGDRLADNRSVFFNGWLEHSTIDFNVLHTTSVLVYSAAYVILLIIMMKNFVDAKESQPFRVGSLHAV